MSENRKLYEKMIENNHKNFKKTNVLKKFKCYIDPVKVATAFKTTNVEAITRNLGDGRSLSWYIEPTVCDAYKLSHSLDKNALCDATIQTKNILINEIKIGIKTLSKNGLDLLQSGFKGRSLSGIDKEARYRALCSSVFLCDYHIVVDSIDAPTFYFNPISSLELLALIIDQKLPLFLNRETFYNIFYGESLGKLLKRNEFEEYKIKQSWLTSLFRKIFNV